ncbi:unnamed protein product [Camellia sinensis]
MQCFLEAADARPKGGADEIIIHNCVAEIREASNDAEAAIATFIVKISFRTCGRSDQFPFVLKRYLCIFKECLALREVINTRVTNNLTTGFQICEAATIKAILYPYCEEDVVGTEEDVKAVVDLLVKEKTQYRVVSIWGMGGLGKTTLAKMVYKNIEIMRHFKCVAWAYISEQCNTREVLEGILIKLLSLSNKERKAIGKLKHDELVKKLHQVQSEKKCLVILDDIWKDADWDSLSPGFPNSTEVGSKILLTTRNKNVAKHVDQQRVLYKLRHLIAKKSWELFVKKTFLRRKEVTGFTLSTEMIELGKAMVKHCGGVPHCVAIIDTNTSRRSGRGTMLDVGMSYLGELVQRCMVQVQLTRFNKRIKLCRLHNLMRDLCLLKAKEENFLEIVHIKAFGHQLSWVDPASSSSSSSSSSSLTTIRRLAMYYLGDRDANSIESRNVNPLSGHEMKNHHHVRSCQFYSFGNELESFGWQKLKLLFKGLTLIAVLDLERITIFGKGKKFPRAIGNLIYLRYLSIRESDTITSLPSSIGNLGFLQTLDLRRWSISSLRIPNVLWRLKQLRHLYLPSRIKLAGTNKLRLDSLNKLETLEYFDTDGRVAPKDLVVMLKSPILNNSNCLLQYLSFWISGDFQTEEEQSLLRQLLGCHHLRQLSLWGYLNLVNKLPDQFPPNLTYLCMGNTELEEDPMPTLEKLPNLRSLILDWNSYIGKEMVCSSAPTTPPPSSRRGFPQLKSLVLKSIQNLEEWKVEQGAMPCLFRLVIVDCPKLKEVPTGLRFITTLRELQIRSVSEALRDRLREGGEEFYKVHHVPSIDPTTFTSVQMEGNEDIWVVAAMDRVHQPSFEDMASKLKEV